MSKIINFIIGSMIIIVMVLIIYLAISECGDYDYLKTNNCSKTEDVRAVNSLIPIINGKNTMLIPVVRNQNKWYCAKTDKYIWM